MILGIDEVGRGPWAGPLTVGAVVLKNSNQDIWQELNDSKKLTVAKRESLNKIVLENAVMTGLGWVKAEELDAVGMSKALKLAVYRAIYNMFLSKDVQDPDTAIANNADSPQNFNFAKFQDSNVIKNKDDFNRCLKKYQQDLPFSKIIIDGTVNFLQGTPLEKMVSVLPKADGKIKEVSAASIIAKVARDSYMVKLAEKYPEYGFEKHVGYGTKFHKEALEKYGPCPEHRKTFKPISKMINNNSTSSIVVTSEPKVTTTVIGRKAETVTINYLKIKGHTILARNYRTKYYEIDIISATKEHIYFTEVKYRKDKKHGNPLESINQKKKKQMAFAAKSFMKYLSKKLKREQDSLPSPILAAASVCGLDFCLEKWFTIDS